MSLVVELLKLSIIVGCLVAVPTTTEKSPLLSIYLFGWMGGFGMVWRGVCGRGDDGAWGSACEVCAGVAWVGVTVGRCRG